MDCREELFFLTYQALNWSGEYVENMPRLDRRWHVERLKKQYEAEKAAVKKK